MRNVEIRNRFSRASQTLHFKEGANGFDNWTVKEYFELQPRQTIYISVKYKLCVTVFSKK